MSHSKANPDVVARFWRSLEERDGSATPSPAVGADDHAEDAGPIAWRSGPAREHAAASLPVGRRGFLQLLGTSIAIPSLAACTRQPPEKIVPYVKAPEDVVPGRPLFYASATTLGGVARGVLVEAHMGRPTKIEGNPEHPSSRGGTDAIAQAEILQLYDPERSQTVLHNGAISSWGELVGALQSAMTSQRSKYGLGLRILTGDTSSPTFIEQMRALTDQLPRARWHVLEPAGPASLYTATKELFGESLDLHLDLSSADVIVSLDADFLGTAESHPHLIREFADKRLAGSPHGAKSGPGATGPMSRLYVFESHMSLTGANADHRVPLAPSQIEHTARLLAAKLMPDRADALTGGAELPEPARQLLEHAAADLARAGRRAVVVAGRFQPPIVHQLAAAMNQALDSRVVSYVDPVLASGTEPVGSLAELVEALNQGHVELLIVMGVNPVHAAPADLDFAAALQKAKLRVHHGLHFDETAALCHWHTPSAHWLEAWSDVRAHDGTVSLVQPLIEPLYGAHSDHELIAALGDNPGRTGYEILRESWRDMTAGAEMEGTWSATLHDGLLDKSEKTRKRPRIGELSWGAAPKPTAGLEVVVRPDPTVYDGRYANNAWLQELPKPITKLTWDNAALLAPRTAAELGLESHDVVALSVGPKVVKASVFVTPGTPPNVVVAHLGYGRERGGEVCRGRGFNAFALTTTTAPFHGPVTLEKTGETYELVTAQLHHSMEGRDLVRRGQAAAYRNDAKLFTHHEHKRVSLYPRHDYPGYSWGMTIDLARCIGCSACVIACQSENNIPVVGKAEVAIGREMHWLRIDRYFEGEPDNPTTHFQPVPCMQCETAPCEAVCPVAATVHHDEGLNDMVYNRCVGTKYCANNCPYKVRRYNFFGYAVEKVGPMDPTRPTVKMANNPDVTVRYYGVMEKCTYCVQRINYARIESKNENRTIRDGEVMTACQAACPARAISFGNINDGESDVSRRKREPRNYAILAELNTEPHTTYLAKLVNENPALTPVEEAPKQGH